MDGGAQESDQVRGYDTIRAAARARAAGSSTVEQQQPGTSDDSQVSGEHSRRQVVREARPHQSTSGPWDRRKTRVV
jgi:hypothetical protein